MNEKIDPRINRTRQLLRNALISLINEKGFSSISIQDIADRSTLNRTTFYLHYRNKNELLADTFRQIVSEATPLPPLNHKPDAQGAIESIVVILNQISKHKDFFRVLLNQETPPFFNSLLREYIMDVGLKWMAALQPDARMAKVSLDIASNFLGGAYLGVIAWWLKNEIPISSEQMAIQLISLTNDGLNKSLGLDPQIY